MKTVRDSRSLIEKNLSRFTSLLQESIFAEDMAARKGWMQLVDPRFKIIGFFGIILASSFSQDLRVNAALYVFSLVLAYGSRVFSASFLRRIWLFVPLYTAIIAIPALFITPGRPLLEIESPPIAITEQGLRSASFLLLRVITSVSFMLLLVLTTPWTTLMKALRRIGLPRIVVFLLAMTYRYIFLLLSLANSLFLGRKSRKVGTESWQTTSGWVGSMFGSLLGKSFFLGNEVHLAMQARGFRGEPVSMDDFQASRRDWLWLMLFTGIAIAGYYFGSMENWI